jgi:transposase
MKKPKKTKQKATVKASKSPKKGRRKPRKASRKRGRPRKTLAQLEATGGYDRNPGRLLKRLGITERAKSPAELMAKAEEVRRWDDYFRRCYTAEERAFYGVVLPEEQRQAPRR